MSVLVDTSVWLRFMADREPWATEAADLIGEGRVTAHPLVYGELLIGDRGGRRELLATFQKFHQATVVAHDEVVALVNLRGLQGRDIGWTDVHLLASALTGGFRLWTADGPLAEVAHELDVGHRIARR